MIELQGKYNTAKVFTDTIESEAVSQIINLLNQEFARDSQIRIMPDTHAGAGCTIGTTMTITDKAVPNLVGVDIGCGMATVILQDTHVQPEQLDQAIRATVPAGFAVHKKQHPFAAAIDLNALRCAKNVNLERARLSLGTLGGGNHFIELDQDPEGRLYLVVHTGSRHLGKQVADHYQKAAVKNLLGRANHANALIDRLKEEGRSSEIQDELAKLFAPKIDKNLAYVEDSLFDDYLHDMKLVQRYADLNRSAIVDTIVENMKFRVDEIFTTTHNYIDTDAMILRKGAVSAQAGERLLIPLNMRDGSLICVGKGNPDWNYSAPHGAGRLMSRSTAKANITLPQFKESMAGIYSTSICRSTVDESPFAYKPMEEIISNIGDTADIITIIKPLYNFKAAD